MSVTADYLGMALKLEDLDGENVAYFKHCAEHSFHLQQCGDCKLLRYPPTTACPWCMSRDAQWVPVEGKGAVHSYTEVHHAIQPAFRAHVPYLILLVDLDTQKGKPTTEEALRVVRLTRPDVLLLDLAMLRRDGVDTLSDLPPDATRVILLTVAMDAEHILRAVQLGARGVVSKESPTQFLIDGIRRVMEGKYVIGSDVVDDFAQVLSCLTAAPPRPYGLTPRELEIAAAVADGEGNREVAQRLSISPQTVKRHLMRVFDKTGVSTRLELALFAIDHGLKK